MDIHKAYEEKSFRDSLATVDEEGKRIWVYPKKPSGRFTRYRTYLSWFLLAFLFAGPWLRINGNPFLEINVLERKFIIFGQIFWPQDFYIFVLVMITGIVFIALFTVIYGRVFCGWICPQTIFMEHVFRKIEYWIEGDWKYQQKLNKSPWNWEKIRKKGLKQIIFFAISFAIANTFLAYIIGSDELVHIQFDNPENHISGLVSLLIFTIIFFWVFSRFREQVCTTVCPYGRLQGVLLDRKSMIVAYDYGRGEERAKFKKGEDRDAVGKGDCIDCHQCVVVCPTGIDIRNGTQLECVNCTACIDACDSIMDSIGKPRGLIRYASEEEIATGKKKFWNTRAIAYTAVLIVLMVVVSVLLLNRSEVDASVLRTPGLTYQQKGVDAYSNLYSYEVANKTNKALKISFKVENSEGEIQMVGSQPELAPQGSAEGAFFLILDKNKITKVKLPVYVEVYADGKLVQTIRTNFFGPLN